MRASFQLGVVGLDPVVGVLLGVVPGSGPQLVQHTGYVGARSVLTSDGTTPVVVLARWNNTRAKSLLRRVDAYTSMTCPNWSTARYK